MAAFDCCQIVILTLTYWRKETTRSRLLILNIFTIGKMGYCDDILSIFPIGKMGYCNDILSIFTIGKMGYCDDILSIFTSMGYY